MKPLQSISINNTNISMSIIIVSVYPDNEDTVLDNADSNNKSCNIHYGRWSKSSYVLNKIAELTLEI